MKQSNEEGWRLDHRQKQKGITQRIFTLPDLAVCAFCMAQCSVPEMYLCMQF